MISRVRIQNFRCLRDVELALTPLTVLVGPNASGKSSVLNALCAGSPKIPTRDYWQQRSDLVVPTLSIWQEAELAWSGRIGDPAGRSCHLLHVDLARARQNNYVNKVTRLDVTGEQLANTIATIPRRQRETMSRLFAELIPVFSDVDVQPVADGNQGVVFQDRWNRNLWYTAGEVSDGTILILSYLTAPYWPLPVDLLAIEEPERGLHPYLLGQLIALFRKLTTGELGGKPVQIVLATHSAELLEFVEPEEVRFLSRDPDSGEVRVENAPTDQEQWVEAYRDYEDSLGNMWLSGSLGGVPGS